MGFFKACVDAFLQFAPVALLYNWNQQPLRPLEGLEGHSEHGPRISGFKCDYSAMPGWRSCNTPTSRDCWLKNSYSRQPSFTQFDINTNYEKYSPIGTTREYWLNVTDHPVAPDGFLKKTGKVFNNTYPGPLIEACWGDNIVVHVSNYIKTNGTTVHWHGIRQLGTTEADGVNGITQCPIAPESSYTYRFRALQYGHTWYHSHYSHQYSDGVTGPLLIHGPNSADWDEAWDPILISDWYHRSAFEEFQQVLDPAGRGPVPQASSIVVDGHGAYVCQSGETGCVEGGGSLFTRVFKYGKRYLIRLINASTDATFIVSIDNHLLQIVSTDFVPVHPYKNTSVLIGIGQRYSVIVEAKPDAPSVDGNYWLRTVVATPLGRCGNITQRQNYTTGIIRYNHSSTALPKTTANVFDTKCSDETYKSLHPVFPWYVNMHPANDPSNNTYEVGLSNSRPPPHGFQRWMIKDRPMWLDLGDPTIRNLDNKAWNEDWAVVDYNYGNNDYVYFIVTGNLERIRNRTAIPLAHPIHLHGHDFALLYQSETPYNETTDPPKFNYNNPPRRDVALLPSNGVLAMAFKADNPGIWLIHCHIAWHASSGLALQILERQGAIGRILGRKVEDVKRVCGDWKTWNSTIGHVQQEDSGI